MGYPLDQRDYETAKELKRRLSDFVVLLDFRVFGSRARGDGGENSDLDIFIEVSSIDKLLRDKILEVVWELSLEKEIVISPLIFTREEIDKSPLRSSPIVRNILRDGVIV